MWPEAGLPLSGPHQPHLDLDHDKVGLADGRLVLCLSSYDLRDWTPPPSPRLMGSGPVGPTREGCTPAQRPEEGPALMSSLGPPCGPTCPQGPPGHSRVTHPQHMRVTWEGPRALSPRPWGLHWNTLGSAGSLPLGEWVHPLPSCLPRDADPGLGRGEEGGGGGQETLQAPRIFLKPSSQSWASVQLPEGRHRRGDPKVGVRVPKGSCEYSNRLIPGQPRRAPSGVLKAQSLAPGGRPRETLPRRPLGIPLKWLQDTTAWPAGRTPSPAPAPTRWKLKNSEQAIVSWGMGDRPARGTDA